MRTKARSYQYRYEDCSQPCHGHSQLSHRYQQQSRSSAPHRVLQTNDGGVNMAGDMEKDKQQSGQYGQGSQQSGQQGQHGQDQKTGQTGHSGQQQQKGNVDPNRKNPSQNDEQEENDRQRRAS